MHALLANVFEVGGELLVEEDHCFAVHHSVLSAAKRKHVNARFGRNLSQRDTETHCGVCKASAVDVQQHAVVVSETGERLQFFLRVDSAHFGSSRDTDHTRLHVVLDADAV